MKADDYVRFCRVLNTAIACVGCATEAPEARRKLLEAARAAMLAAISTVDCEIGQAALEEGLGAPPRADA